MAYRDFPHFEASLWSGENSIGPRTFRVAKSRVDQRRRGGDELYLQCEQLADGENEQENG